MKVKATLQLNLPSVREPTIDGQFVVKFSNFGLLVCIVMIVVITFTLELKMQEHNLHYTPKNEVSKWPGAQELLSKVQFIYMYFFSSSVTYISVTIHRILWLGYEKVYICILNIKRLRKCHFTTDTINKLSYFSTSALRKGNISIYTSLLSYNLDTITLWTYYLYCLL